LKPQERDELLIRLDERTDNIYKLTEKQEKHLSELNDKVSKNTINVDRNDKRIVRLEECIANGVDLHLTKRQVTVGGASVVSLIILALTALGTILGWW